MANQGAYCDFDVFARQILVVVSALAAPDQQSYVMSFHVLFTVEWVKELRHTCTHFFIELESGADMIKKW